jgi:hypothetical protein
MRKITHVAWFTKGLHTVGIILTGKKDEEPKAYIGVGVGIDEHKDMISIAHWGAKFPIEAAAIVIKEKGIRLVTPIEVLQNEG